MMDTNLLEKMRLSLKSIFLGVPRNKLTAEESLEPIHRPTQEPAYINFMGYYTMQTEIIRKKVANFNSNVTHFLLRQNLLDFCCAASIDFFYSGSRTIYFFLYPRYIPNYLFVI